MENDIRVIRLQKAFRDSGLTQKEVCERTGITPGAMSSYLSGRYFPKQRALDALSRVLNVPILYLMGRSVDSQDETLAADNLLPVRPREIPILGTICAGDGIYAEENYEGTFTLDKSIYADFAIRVKGDSMIGSGILDGDLAFIRKSDNFVDGRIYAVIIKGSNEATLKAVNSFGDFLVLTPSNPSYGVITVDQAEVHFVGELVGVYHPCV